MAEQLLLSTLKVAVNVNLVIQVKCLQAILYYKKDKTKKALKLLKESLWLSEKGGGIRFYLDLGLEMIVLFNLLQKEDEKSAFVNQILLQLPSTKLISKESLEKVKHLQPLGNITAKELEILKLLAQGHKNAEIATVLNYSQGTVKVYLHSIYKKIGAKNRVHASSILNEYKTAYQVD